MGLSLALLAAATYSSAVPAHGAEPLQPTGQWVVEYSDNMCVLQRDYGTAGKPLVLSFRPSLLSDHLNLYVFDARTGQSGDSVSVRIGFGPKQKSTGSYMETFDPKDSDFRYNGAGILRSELERAAISGVMSLRSVGRINVAFQVPKLSTALIVLDDCAADLLEAWGLKRADQKLIAKPARILDSLNGAFLFPQKAFKNNSHGINSARVWVDTKGRASDCAIVEASGDPLLDDAICKGLLKSHFGPAKDQSGKPLRTIYFTRVRWVIPH
jgi:TonB family protein